MIDSLIYKLKRMNEELYQELITLKQGQENNTAIHTIMDKILDHEQLSFEEIKILGRIDSEALGLTDEETYRLHFIELITNLDIRLDENQIALCKKIKEAIEQLPTVNNSIDSLDNRMKRNKSIVKTLSSQEIFDDFESLKEVLVELKLEMDEILKLIQEIIFKNNRIVVEQSNDYNNIYYEDDLEKRSSF